MSVSDARAVGEMSGNSLIRDVLSGIELQRRWQIDAPAGGESRKSWLVDSYSQQEALFTIGSDSIEAFEYTGMLRADAWQTNENQRLFVGDRSSYTESATTISYDEVALAETRRGAIADAIAQTESNRSALADTAALLELFAARMIVDAFGGIENLVNRTTDGRGIAESAASITKDQLSATEYLGQVITDRQIALELLARLVTDRLGGIEAGGATGIITVADTRQALIESLGSVLRDVGAQVENLAIAPQSSDLFAAIESVRAYIDDRIWRAEALASVVVDRPAAGENAQNARFDSFPRQESRAGQIGDAAASVEEGGGVRGDASAQQEALTGLTIVAIDATELLRRVVADLPGGAAETHGSTLFETSAILLEVLAGTPGDTAGSIEAQANRRTRMLAAIEAQGLTGVLADSLVALEIAGISLIPSASARGLSEFGQAAGYDTRGQIETQATMGFPFDPDGAVLIDGPYLVLDKTRTSISSGRIRIITVPYASLGIAVQPFDPIAANTLEIFALDFTLDAATATIVKTAWVATFDPGSTTATDDTPQARVLAAWPASTVYTVNPLDNSLQTWPGQFSCAAIGTCPATAAGGTYTLSATINLSDTRVLQITSTVLCVGQQV